MLNTSENLATRKPWTICRRFSELRLSHRMTLPEWAERGRLLSSDYVFDRDLDTWVCARDLEELKAFFRRQKAIRARRVSGVLLVAALVCSLIAPVPATLLLAAGGIFILKYRVVRSD